MTIKEVLRMTITKQSVFKYFEVSWGFSMSFILLFHVFPGHVIKISLNQALQSSMNYMQ